MKPLGILSALLLVFTHACIGQESVELRTAHGNRVWVYLPKSGRASATLPCVIVPPAGSRLFHGIRLTDGDRAEHRPYVEAGYAVVSFDISGELADPQDVARAREAIKRFLAAQYGVADAQEALDTARKRFPQISETNLYVAGHSSAATLALQIAANDPRIKACIALAPIGDLAERLGPAGLTWLDQVVAGSAAKLVAQSPCHLGKKIRCPVFLFHALDDDNVLPATVLRLKDAFEASGVKITYRTAPTGGHYDSMIDAGLPAAINWLRTLDRVK